MHTKYHQLLKSHNNHVIEAIKNCAISITKSIENCISEIHKLSDKYEDTSLHYINRESIQSARTDTILEIIAETDGAYFDDRTSNLININKGEIIASIKDSSFIDIEGVRFVSQRKFYSKFNLNFGSYKSSEFESRPTSYRHADNNDIIIGRDKKQYDINKFIDDIITNVQYKCSRKHYPQLKVIEYSIIDLIPGKYYDDRKRNS